MTGPGMIERAGLRALRALDPEAAHRLALAGLKSGLASPTQISVDPVLRAQVLGMDLPSPIGVAAGFDKNAEVPNQMLEMGFGFVEVGAVTPRPQAGNSHPRLFRLTGDRAAINRFGFNNDGLEAIRARLLARPRKGIVWANLGANKDSPDRIADYIEVMRGLHGLVQAMTLNISSPNTERLRDLQGPAALDELLRRCLAARNDLATRTGTRTPVMLKISPDLTPRERAGLAEVCLGRDIDAIIAANTTTGLRDALRDPRRMERGGLSGAPLFALSTQVLRDMRRLTGGRIPLIGVGGVASAGDALEKITGGASLVQLYTAMVYEGPGLGARIAADLAILLRAKGFNSLVEAVGADNPV